MAVLIALGAIGLFAAGVTTGIIGVVCLAVHREERFFTLTSKPPDNVTRAGRWLNGVYVRYPGRPFRASTASTEIDGERGNGR